MDQHNPNMATWIGNYIIMTCGMKLSIHSHISKVQSLKFGSGYVISTCFLQLPTVYYHNTSKCTWTRNCKNYINIPSTWTRNCKNYINVPYHNTSKCTWTRNCKNYINVPSTWTRNCKNYVNVQHDLKPWYISVDKVCADIWMDHKMVLNIYFVRKGTMTFMK